MSKTFDWRVAPVHGKLAGIWCADLYISGWSPLNVTILDPTSVSYEMPVLCVLCTCTWTMYVTVCAVGLQWQKLCKKCPEHLSSSLLTTAAERIKLFTGCHFFACLVFSPHDMNVFVTDFTVDYVVTHVQGFSSGILTNFCQKLCVKCEGIWYNVWLTYTVNMWLPCM